MDDISQKISEKKEEILEFAKSLIRIPTQNPPQENYEEIIKVLQEKLVDFELKIYSKNSKPNLVVFWDVGAKETLHINGHYDVVPATNNWNSNPFEPIVKEGKLFGRGSCDMKSSLAVMTYSLIILKELGLIPTVNVELSFTCDEESGGQDGVGFLVNEKKVNPNYALILDGADQIINYAHKGVLALDVVVIGKASHAARPDLGVNAFLGACKLAEKFDAFNKKYITIKSECDTIDEIAKSPSIVVGGLTKGGNKFNTIPGNFSFTIDRRIIPEENIDKVKQEIFDVSKQFEKEYPQLKVNMNILLEAESALGEKQSKISVLLADSFKKIKNEEPKITMMSGFLDMRYFVNTAKIPCVNLGLKGSNIHGDNEYVEISSIYETINIISNLLLNNRWID
jgi:succinyl-diaminopimelate desuccinylase